MSKSKFIRKIRKILGFKVDDDCSKKKAIKNLLGKLEAREKSFKKKLKKTKNKSDKEELKDNIAILQKQIKKGKRLL